MLKTQKKLITAFLTLAAAGIGIAFNWPQKGVSQESFQTQFGQLKGDRISPSLIFEEDSDVHAADSGNVALILSDHSSDFGWFVSTLGNATILAHSGNLMTVYGNLDADSIPDMATTVTQGDNLGKSGNSGWQETQSFLEFQVIDTKNKTAVNPKLLMPRTEEETALAIGDLTLDDSKNVTHHLLNERVLPAGTYRLYHTRQDNTAPYNTSVAINGATVENISYDTLQEYKGRLCVTGNAKYTVEDLYPDEKRQLLSVITLSRGHSTLSVTVFDLLGKTKSIKYNLDIN